MKCDYCGYENSEYSIRCDKCGKPLSIEKNLALQKKYNHKQKAIDIVRITPDYELIRFNSTKQSVKYFLAFLSGVLFISIILFFVLLYNNSKYNDSIEKINRALNRNEESIIYIGKNNTINDNLLELSKKYDFNYTFIKYNKITLTKRAKIKKILDTSSINNKVFYIKNGKILKSNIVNDTKDIKKLLEKNGLISSYDGNPQSIINKYEDAFNTQTPLILYISNNNNDTNSKHNNLLNKFCENYSLDYLYIEGYKLSDIQKLRILKKLNYNVIHSELLVILDEGSIKNVSEFVSDNKSEYFELISNYGIIDESSVKKLNTISIKQFSKIIKKDENNVIIITSNNCQYCEKVKPILGKIAIQNDLTIYNYNYKEKDKAALEKYLTKRGFKKKTITTPMVIISKNNKINDYIIGVSSKNFYEEKFKEYGLIR